MPILYPLVRSLLFRLPAETAHELVIGTLASLPGTARATLRARNSARDPRLRTRAFGIDFPNPIGLGAGFDKSGAAFNTLGALGFGFVEIGTITALGQGGNPRPRIFRLPEDEALLNRMGFNNPGAEAVARRLAHEARETVLGINLGKSKVTPLERAVDDYTRSVDLLRPFADYLVVNVSSPNTPGLRELQEAAALRELLTAVVARAVHEGRRIPVLVKLAPDLADPQIDQAVEIATAAAAAGIVAVNTTISRESLRTESARVTALGAGGISGQPLRDRAQEVVARIYRAAGANLPIVGVGGIFDADDAWDRIRAGASLIQLYTGFVYGGPGVAREIQRGLARKLDEHGLATIADAVGTGAGGTGAGG